jgi:hypothetical protein
VPFFTTHTLAKKGPIGTNYLLVKGDTAAIILAGVKIVQKSKNRSNENKTQPAMFR